jgi:cation diffusion facilitator family transporter
MDDRMASHEFLKQRKDPVHTDRIESPPGETADGHGHGVVALEDRSTVPAADRQALRFAMTLSLVIGLLMFAIKVGAYVLTGSAAILSDAAESVVHVAAVTFAFYSLRLSFKPADEQHRYGHAKISFFSAGFEGAMILLAAAYIGYEAIRKLIFGTELHNLGIGTSLTVLAMLINGGLGGYLIVTGRRCRSLILIANGKHVLTDVWTSLGVIAGLGLTLGTGWLAWDPIAALVVAGNIVVSGVGLIRESVRGLMDVADPQIDRQLTQVLKAQTQRHGIQYHDLRHRHLGSTYWVEVHLLFPQSLTIGTAHRIATEIEEVMAAAIEIPAYVTTHLEAIEDHECIHPPGLH